MSPCPHLASPRKSAHAEEMNQPRTLAAALSLALAWILCLPSAPAQANPAPQQRATSTPYAGDLSIFESPDRDQKVQPQRVMDLLHITPGTSVADIGAGSGWFSVRAAHRVGPKGKVYAEDINPQYIAYIQDRARKANLTNIQTVQGTPDDAHLPPDSIHAVMLMKVYHEIAHPVPFLRSLRAALEPSARIGIIDRNGDGSGTDHGVPETTVVREMAEAGFRKVGRYDFTKADGQDYFLIFQPAR